MFEVFYVLSGAGRFAITERGSDREWRRREVAAPLGLAGDTVKKQSIWGQDRPSSNIKSGKV